MSWTYFIAGLVTGFCLAIFFIVWVKEEERKTSGIGALAGMVVGVTIGLPFGALGVFVGGILGSIIGDLLEAKSK